MWTDGPSPCYSQSQVVSVCQSFRPIAQFFFPAKSFFFLFNMEKGSGHRPKVKEELFRMEKMGMISKIITPTPWCAGMVVVPKKSGAVRICVDLKPLNESVL